MSVTSVPAAEIIALSKGKGFLAKQLYVVVTTPARGMGPVMEKIKEHLAFQETLEAQGIMFAAASCIVCNKRTVSAIAAVFEATERNPATSAAAPSNTSGHQK